MRTVMGLPVSSRAGIATPLTFRVRVRAWVRVHLKFKAWGKLRGR